MILNNKEINLIKEKTNKLRLHLKFENEFIPSKKASFFLWIKYICEKKNNSTSKWLDSRI